MLFFINHIKVVGEISNGRPLMSVLVKYVCLYTRENIQRNAVKVIYFYWKLVCYGCGRGFVLLS